MAIVPTPETGKQITDYTAGTFDGNSLIYQSRNGQGYKISGDDVGTYTVGQQVHSGLGNKTVKQYVDSHVDYVEVSGTLTAGATSITLSDASITATSTIDVYTDIFGAWLENMVVSTGSVVLTFEAQSANMAVKVRVS